MVHLAVAVGDGSEIQTRHRETESRRFEALTVPQGLHNIESAVFIHDFGSATHDADDFVLTEAVEELAHPDHIIMFVCRERLRGIQEVHAIAIDAVGTWLACCIATHHFQLLGQVNDGHLNILVKSDALQGPTTRVAAYIKQRLRFIGEHNFKGLLERTVAVEMVETEPTFLHLGRQLRQTFVHRRPRTKVFKASRATLFQAFLEMEPPFVIYIVVELSVDVGGAVCDEAPTCLA